MQSRVVGTMAVTELLVLGVLENSAGEERKAPASAQPPGEARRHSLDCFSSRHGVDVTQLGVPCC